MTRFKYRPKRVDAVARGRPEAAAGGVDRDQVDVGEQAVEEGGEVRCQVEGVVDAGEEDILEGQAAVRLVDIIAAGRHKFPKRVLAGDGHQLGAKVVVGGVEAHREVDLRIVEG